MSNPFDLSGKNILITGASSGLGKAIAIECSKMGAQVILNGRNQNRLEETYSEMIGQHHVILPADISDDAQLNNLINDVDCIDGLVLCVGVSGLLPIKLSSKKKLEKMFDTNFFSNAELLRLLLKNKKIKPGGSILAIASIGGVTDFTIGKAMYGSTKAALASYMKYVAKEVAHKGIRANCLCPGFIMTPLAEAVGYASVDLEKDLKTYPLGRYGTPEEVAYIALYFLSDASKWVTGTNFIIDGGHTI